MSQWYTFPNIVVTKDASKKHYKRTGISASCSISGSYSSDFQTPIQYIFCGKRGDIQTSHITSYSFSGTTDNYTSNVYLQMYLASGKPISYASSSAHITYGDKLAFEPILSKTSGYISPVATNDIKVNCKSIDADENYTVKSGTLYYRKSGTSAYSQVTFTGNIATIPANTLQYGFTYDVYASCVADDDTTANTPTYQYVTTDVTGTCIAIEPVNSVQRSDIKFVWSYNNSLGNAQYAYDLQTSTDGLEWSTIADHVESDITEHNATITASNTIYWRVRAYNQQNNVGEWSEKVTFINLGEVTAPTITDVIGNGRKTVKWASNNQIAYRVVLMDGDIVIKDSGTIYSVNKSYLINEYPDYGTYTIKVSVTDVYGRESAFSEVQTTYSPYATNVNATLTSGTDSVNINIKDVNAFVKYYIVRNGTVISKAKNGMYYDYTADGLNEYKIIGVTSDDYYNYIKFNVTFKHKNTIIFDGENAIRCNLNWGSRVTPNYSITPDYAQFNYFGATAPAFTFSKLKTKTYNVTVFDKDNKFDALIGKVIYFATTYGYGDWCVITSLNRTDHIYGNTVSLNLSMTSYEGIEYDL